MTALAMPPRVELEELADHYDGFLFDQFGVLHNGVTAYPGRYETLLALKQQGKRIGVISNSGKRAFYNQERLSAFGFDESTIDIVVSSGELAWQLLAALCQPANETQYKPPRRTKHHAEDTVTMVNALPASFERFGYGSAVYMLHAASTSCPQLMTTATAYVDSLPISLAATPAEAALLLIDGNEQAITLHQWREILAPAAAQGVPALCTNPDKVCLLPDGTLGVAPGQIAETYASLGADVLYVGKPYSSIYQYALAQLNTPAAATLCIGDSVEHDIVGAKQAGCPSVLTRTGILSTTTDKELQNLFIEHRAAPTYRC